MKNSMFVKVGFTAAFGLAAIAANAQVSDSSEKMPPIYVYTPPLSTMIMQPMGSVVKVKLDKKLQSNVAKKGDVFTATLDTGKAPDYFGLPAGTKIEGHVSDVRAKEGKTSGMISLEPDTVIMSDGTRYPIEAAFMKIEKKTVTTEKGGRMMATNAAQSTGTNYIVTGAAVGVGIAAIAGGDLLAGGLLGAAIGFFIGQQRGVQARDVTLNPGYALGVRFDKNTPIEIPIN